MDKFEYNIKVEKMRKLVENRDFVTAAQVVDGIDWKRVKDTRTLSVVSMIYERNHRYTDAKNILMLLYESGPGGRRLIYKLAELSAKEHKFDDAEMFYREYEELAPGDRSIYTLRYEIMLEQNAPLRQLIEVLENYLEEEFDEKWSYELARLYHKAGRSKDCVRLCDNIILWFSVGPYVERAARLKEIYEPLTPEQEEKVRNQDKYEANLRQVAEECEIQAEKKIEEAQARRELQREAEAQLAVTTAEETERAEEPEPSVEPVNKDDTISEGTDNNVACGDQEGDAIFMNEENQMGYGGDQRMDTETKPVGEINQTEIMSTQSVDTAVFDPEEKSPDILSDVESDTPAGEITGRQWENEVEKIISNFNRELNAGIDEDVQEKNESGMVQGLLYVSAPGTDQGMEYATEAIKELRRMEGKKANKVARITGTKLNLVGFGNSIDKLNGADLVIVEAAQLSNMTLMEILRLTQKESLQNIIVFVDTADGIEQLDARAKDAMVEVLYRIEQEERARKEAHKIQIRPVMMPEKSLVDAKFAMEEEAAASMEPDLLDLDSQIPDPVVRPMSVNRQYPELSGVDRPQYQDMSGVGRQYQGEVGTNQSPYQGAAGMSQSQYQPVSGANQPQYQATPAIDPDSIKANLVSVAENMVYQDEEIMQAAAGPAKETRRDTTGEMSVPVFVARIKEYAEELDCVIEEIAGLAIYALADKYSEEGEVLNDDLAREVTEAAVIRADKRGLGGLFSSKYDKEGRLILKEAHFKL